MSSRAHYVEIGEPIDSDTVWAVWRTMYHDDTPDEIRVGTLPMHLTELWDEHTEHQMSDTSLLVSNIPADDLRRISDGFEEDERISQLADYIAESSAARGVDQFAVSEFPINNSDWAKMTGRDQSSVARNVRRARESSQ